VSLIIILDLIHVLEYLCSREGCGQGLLGVPYLGVTDTPSPDPQQHELVKKRAATVVAHEDSYASVSRNTDGTGASVGIFQWPQRSSDMGRLLQPGTTSDPS